MRATGWCILNWSVVRSFVRLAVRSLVRLFVWSVGFSFARSFVRPFVCSFVGSLVTSFSRSFVRSYARSLVWSFARSFGRWAVHLVGLSLARSFGRLFVVLKLLYCVTDNPPTLSGIDDNKVCVSTTNYQYHDDAEEFLSSEVFSNYGDLLVSFNGPSMYWSDMRVSLLASTRSANVCHGMTEAIKSCDLQW